MKGSDAIFEWEHAAPRRKALDMRLEEIGIRPWKAQLAPTEHELLALQDMRAGWQNTGMLSLVYEPTTSYAFSLRAPAR